MESRTVLASAETLDLARMFLVLAARSRCCRRSNYFLEFGIRATYMGFSSRTLAATLFSLSSAEVKES